MWPGGLIPLAFAATSSTDKHLRCVAYAVISAAADAANTGRSFKEANSAKLSTFQHLPKQHHEKRASEAIIYNHSNIRRRDSVCVYAP